MTERTSRRSSLHPRPPRPRRCGRCPRLARHLRARRAPRRLAAAQAPSRSLPHCIGAARAPRATSTTCGGVTGEADGDHREHVVRRHRRLQDAGGRGLAARPHAGRRRAARVPRHHRRAAGQGPGRGRLPQLVRSRSSSREARGRSCTGATSCTARATSSRPPSPPRGPAVGESSSRSPGASRT